MNKAIWTRPIDGKGIAKVSLITLGVAGVAVAGYFVGVKHTVIKSQRPDVLITAERYMNEPALRATQLTIPVTFSGGKWSGCLDVYSPSGDLIAFTKGGSLTVWYDKTMAPLEPVYLALWSMGTLTMVRVTAAELEQLQQIQCTSSGLYLTPTVGARGWIPVSEASIANLPNSVPFNEPPDAAHRIVFRYEGDTRGMHYTIALVDEIDLYSPLLQTLEIEPSSDSMLNVRIGRDSYDARRSYLLVVHSVGYPVLAMRVRGSDLARLETVTFTDPKNLPIEQSVTFSPSIPVDFWPLSGGSQ